MEKPCIDRDVVARLKSPPSSDERANWPAFTMATVRAHRALESRGWIVVRERVFDITAFARTHPGFFNAGQVSTAIAVARALGTDATDDFESIHSPRAWTQLADFQIGVLETTDDENACDGKDGAFEADGVETPATPVPRWLSNDRDFWVRYGADVSNGVRRAVGEGEDEGEGEARDDDDDGMKTTTIAVSTRSSSTVVDVKTIGRWVARAVVAAVARALAARVRRKRRDESSRCALDDGRDVRLRSRASSEPMD